jgi:hypothetical protein
MRRFSTFSPFYFSSNQESFRGVDRFLRVAVLSVATVLTMFLWVSSNASAQTSIGQFGARVGSGLEIGAGEGSKTVKRPSPIFVDLDIRTWTDEQGAVIYGGSLRMEVAGKASIAAVPRLELRRMLGSLELRPGVAIPMFLAPFLMFGVEGGLSVRFPIGGGFGVMGALTGAGFFFGDDVPDNSVVVMFNGSLGIDIQI